MLRIADQSLALGIDDPIQHFERNLADDHGEIIIDFADIQMTLAVLNREADCCMERHVHGAAHTASFSSHELSQTQVSDHFSGQEQHAGTGVDKRIVDDDAAHLVTRDFAAIGAKKVIDVFDLRGHQHLSHRCRPHG